MEIIGSPQQQEIWRFMRQGTAHGCVDAVAGSGKTFTIVEGVRQLPSTLKILLLAFNVHIAQELNRRLGVSPGSNITATTYNSFGWRILRENVRHCELLKESGEKIDLAVDRIVPKYDQWKVSTILRRIIPYMKYHLWEPTPETINRAVEMYDIDMTADGRDQTEKIIEYAPKVFAECRDNTDVADYDDQIWLPVVHSMAIPQYDLVMVDEAQDTNQMQQALALKAVERGGRLIVVGDKNQAIYGFRGADHLAIPRMRDALRTTNLGCEVLPLTVSRRCPVSHIELAQEIVPHIEALEEAPRGNVDVLKEIEEVEKKVQPGDLILSRVNAPLLPLCYRFLKRGRKAVIRGRDIGRGLSSLVSKLKAVDMPDLMKRLEQYETVEAAKLAALGKKGASRLNALHEKVDCLVELSEGINDIPTLQRALERMFSDESNAGGITLGTVHRTKGLEAPNVFVVSPELIPHPMAKTPEAQEQENNLAYVSVTRAKFSPSHQGALYWIGQRPPAFGGPKPAWKKRFFDEEAA